MTHNVALNRFEWHVGNASPAILTYLREGNHVIFDHIFVPEELRGCGLAAELAQAALNEARQRHWKIVPRCSYVASFINRHPAYADLVDPDIPSSRRYPDSP